MRPRRGCTQGLYPRVPRVGTLLPPNHFPKPPPTRPIVPRSPGKADSPPRSPGHPGPSARQRPRHRLGSRAPDRLSGSAPPSPGPRFQAPQRRSTAEPLPHGAARARSRRTTPVSTVLGPHFRNLPPIRGRWAPLPRAGSASRWMPRQTPANTGFMRAKACPATRENARPARSEQGNAHADTAGRSGKPSALVPPEPEPQQKERSEHNDDMPANWSGG
jgi:hypothetical protein